MDATPFRIFVVDDDPLTRMIVANQFDQSRYEIAGFDSGARLAINYPRATLMVLDLPLDEERVGRLRDHLAVLVEAADARLEAQENENQRLLQAEAIMATAEITPSLSEIEQSQNTKHKPESGVQAGIQLPGWPGSCLSPSGIDRKAGRSTGRNGNNRHRPAQPVAGYQRVSGRAFAANHRHAAKDGGRRVSRRRSPERRTNGLGVNGLG